MSTFLLQRALFPVYSHRQFRMIGDRKFRVIHWKFQLSRTFHSQIDLFSENFITSHQNRMTSVFGVEFEKTWPTVLQIIQISSYGQKLLANCRHLPRPDSNQKTDLDAFRQKSASFPLKFPLDTCRVHTQPVERQEQIKRQINSAYPLIHERVLKLYLDFLEHKVHFGSKQEKELYGSLNVNDLVQRFLVHRCASFFGRNDRFKLISGEEGYGGFLEVGGQTEKPPLLLKNVLSYDEIKLSALLSVSSFSELINDGRRDNKGVVEQDKRKIEREGVIVGLIGARLNKRNAMEFQDIIISPNQNTAVNGYGREVEATVDEQECGEGANAKAISYRNVWKRFYEEKDFLYEQIKKDGQRFDSTSGKGDKDIFDNLIMKKRYSIAFDTLLLESEARAKAAGKLAYIHVVGIGLGVWKVAAQQEKIFLETFNQRLKQLLPQLNNIGVVHFSWFSLKEWHDLKDGAKIVSDTHPLGGIMIHISRRNPAEKLSSPEHENMLLIISYAWDGNALPGNEFWMGMLASTGDSSTACSTLITELHNPHINSDWVRGDNLHIASEAHGILHIADYAQKILNSS